MRITREAGLLIAALVLPLLSGCELQSGSAPVNYYRPPRPPPVYYQPAPVYTPPPPVYLPPTPPLVPANTPIYLPPPPVVVLPPSVPSVVVDPPAAPLPPAVYSPQPLPVVPTPPSSGVGGVSGWVDAVSRQVEGNLSLSIRPDRVAPLTSARVTWQSGSAVGSDYYFAGFDKYGALVVVDYNHPGAQSGYTDQFKEDLERVAIWKMSQHADF